MKIARAFEIDLAGQDGSNSPCFRWDGRTDSSEALLTRLTGKLQRAPFRVNVFRRTVPMRLVTLPIQICVFNNQFGEAPKEERSRLFSNYSEVATGIRSLLLTSTNRPVVETFMFRNDFQAFLDGTGLYSGSDIRDRIRSLEHMVESNAALTLMDDIGWPSRELEKYNGIMLGENSFVFCEDRSHYVTFSENVSEILAIQKIMSAVQVASEKNATRITKEDFRQYKADLNELLLLPVDHIEKS